MCLKLLDDLIRYLLGDFMNIPIFGLGENYMYEVNVQRYPRVRGTNAML